VQTFSGRRVDVDLDGTIEMSAEDAQYYIRDGWIELAECTIDDGLRSACRLISQLCTGTELPPLPGHVRRSGLMI
jgi:hypothetical protein